jgi:hypothetical protein
MTTLTLNPSMLRPAHRGGLAAVRGDASMAASLRS